MRFLVTGGAGFIGSHLCESLIQEGHHVTCLDNFNNYYAPTIKRLNIHSLLSHPGFRLIEGDILQWDFLEQVLEEGDFNVVVHLAARAGVRPSIQQPRLYQQVNIEGTTNLLDICSRLGNLKFIMASSSSVYGKNKKVPFSEEDSVDFPISPYAATKKACELLGYTYSSLHSLPVTCLRFFTVYGPRQRPDMAIHKFTRCIIRGREITVFGDGSSRRDYTYITDIIDGILKAIRHCQGYHIYNLGESDTVDLTQLIRLLEEIIGEEAKIKRLPDQPGDVPLTYADVSKAKREIGYQPGVPLRQGLEAFVRWYREVGITLKQDLEA